MNNYIFVSVWVHVHMSEVFQAMQCSGFLDVVDRAMKRLPGSAQCHHHSPSQRPLCLPAFLCFHKVNNKSREKKKVCMHDCVVIMYSNNLAKLDAGNCKVCKTCWSREEDTNRDCDKTGKKMKCQSGKGSLLY